MGATLVIGVGVVFTKEGIVQAHNARYSYLFYEGMHLALSDQNLTFLSPFFRPVEEPTKILWPAQYCSVLSLSRTEFLNGEVPGTEKEHI